MDFTLSFGNFSFYSHPSLLGLWHRQTSTAFDLISVLGLPFANRSKRWRTLFVKLAEKKESQNTTNKSTPLTKHPLTPICVTYIKSPPNMCEGHIFQLWFGKMRRKRGEEEGDGGTSHPSSSPPLFIVLSLPFFSQNKNWKTCFVILFCILCTNWCRWVCSRWSWCVFRFCFLCFLSGNFSKHVPQRLLLLVKKSCSNQRPSFFLSVLQPGRERGKNEKLQADKVKVKSIKNSNLRSQGEISLTLLGFACWTYVIDLAFTWSSGNFSFSLFPFLVCGTDNKWRPLIRQALWFFFFGNRSRRWRTPFCEIGWIKKKAQTRKTHPRHFAQRTEKKNTQQLQETHVFQFLFSKKTDDRGDKERRLILYHLLSPRLFSSYNTKIGKMLLSQLSGDHFSYILRKLVWVVRSEWRECVSRKFFFPSFHPISQKVSFSVCFDLWKIRFKRLWSQRPSIFVCATHQEGKVRGRVRAEKKRKVAKGQSESQINQIFQHMKPRKVKLNSS